MTSGDKPWFANPLLHHRVTDLFSSFPTDTPPPPAAPQQDPTTPNTDQTRAYWSQADQAMRGMIDALFGAEVVEDKAEVRDFKIAAVDGAQIDARLYAAAPTADGERPPLALSFHGGGMTASDFNMVFELNLCHRLAKANVSVLSVDFRNAYVKPFPGGVDDCLAAVNWARDNQDLLGVSDCLVTCGPSGGGNLSIATFIRALQKGCADQIDGIISEAPFIAGQYPAEGMETHTAYDGFLSAQGLQEWVNNYTTSKEDYENPAAWPLKARDEVLAAFPPTLIIVEQFDPLRSDGEALFQRLRRLRVESCSMIMRCGEIHGQAYTNLVESNVAELHAEHLAAFVRVQARHKRRRAQ